jgi:hypothetical protein
VECIENDKELRDEIQDIIEELLHAIMGAP